MRADLLRCRRERIGLRAFACVAYFVAACFAGASTDSTPGGPSVGMWTPFAAAATLAVVRGARVCARIEDLEAEVARLEELALDDRPSPTA